MNGPMPKAIDHILVLVRDLAAASVDYTAAGFTVTPGGRHTDGATHNALISFADGTYLELIAPASRDCLPDDGFLSRLRRGEGLTQYALGADDLAVEAARLRDRGVPTVGPGDGGRERPDGQRVHWRMLAAHPDSAVLPFLIADVTPRALRVPGGAAARHRLGVTRVVGLTVAVADLPTRARELGDLLGTTGRALDLSGVGAAVQFAVGTQWVVLAQPADDTSLPGRALATWGEGPYEVALSAGRHAAPGVGALLPSALLHGARFRMVP